MIKRPRGDEAIHHRVTARYVPGLSFSVKNANTHERQPMGALPGSPRHRHTCQDSLPHYFGMLNVIAFKYTTQKGPDPQRAMAFTDTKGELKPRQGCPWWGTDATPMLKGISRNQKRREKGVGLGARATLLNIDAPVAKPIKQSTFKPIRRSALIFIHRVKPRRHSYRKSAFIRRIYIYIPFTLSLRYKVL